MIPQVNIIGAGLAGSEAAYFLARHGVPVRLIEMRPLKMTEAHLTGNFAELVCSNSLKSKDPNSAPGILKSEMREIGSLILEAAEVAEVPGGQALAVDRERFSEHITQRIKKEPLISVASEEWTGPSAEALARGETFLIATGPLTSPALSSWLSRVAGDEGLYFYDAIAPIVDASTLDRELVFPANRYDKGDEVAYLNCPFTKDQYEDFVAALLTAEQVPPKKFEKEKFFQGCQPIEVIAAGGSESLRYGPMKPVGLTDPRTGRTPHAVVQLRPENRSLTAYNLVGFQTKLKYGEQAKVFRKIPGLEKAEFLRMGSIHRNTYVCGPQILKSDLSLKGHPRVYLAGQITGVEGYLESAATGLLAGVFIAQRCYSRPLLPPPANTALGALLRHVVSSDPKNYQPSNIHFGLLEPIYFSAEEGGVEARGRDKIRQNIAELAPKALKKWWISTLPLKH